jgi:predicted O-methyltransferase YrrM
LLKKLLKKIIPRSIIRGVQSIKYKPLVYAPHGHFYSPIVSKIDINQFESFIWKHKNEDTIAGIDLNTNIQLEILRSFEKYYEEIPFKEEKNANHRFFLNNSSYSYTDSIILYSFMRHYKPKRIIEIGSGYSSALMLDTNEHFNLGIELCFIEPHSKLLLSLLKKGDSDFCKIYESKVQDVPLQNFLKLRQNDILFIDSSHITKTGSDVNFEFFEILTNLNSGVIIHFHDIFYPFEYPKEWVMDGKNWNEAYLLRAFLSYNNEFEILHFSQYVHEHHKDAFKRMPLAYKNKGGNLWIRRK